MTICVPADSNTVKLSTVSRGRRALLQVPKPGTRTEKRAPEEKQSPAQQFCAIGNGTALGSEQDPADEHSRSADRCLCHQPDAAVSFQLLYCTADVGLCHRKATCRNSDRNFSIPCCRVLLEHLTFSHLFKKLPYYMESQS